MSTGQGASLNGFRPFSSDSLWNQDISGSPVDPNSSAIINFIGPTVGMHADFGSGQYQGSNIGIPYSVVSGTQTPVNITFTAYGSESDPGPMPVPAQRADRRRSESGQWRSPRAGARQQQLLSLRVVQRRPQRQRDLECRFGSGLGPAGERAASLDVDVRRCRRPADLSRAGALRRSSRRDRFSTPFASPCRRAGPPWCCRPRIGRPTPPVRMRRPWACACA